MASLSWVILSRVPRVCSSDELPITWGDLSLDLVPPPGVTVLTMGPHIAPNPITLDNPFLLVADPTGLLLISTTLGRANDPVLPYIANPRLAQLRDLLLGNFLPGYFVCDAASPCGLTSRTASRLPDPEVPVARRENLGIIPSPAGGGHYMVVEFQPIAGSDQAILLCFSSHTRKWVTKQIYNPVEARLWSSDDVIAHDGKLWWVDLNYGMLTCDPFDDVPEMCLVIFPRNGVEEDELANAHKTRCVKVSKGKMRFMELFPGLDYDDRNVVIAWMWTMTEQLRSTPSYWLMEYKVSFLDIWDNDSYMKTGLPTAVPTVAFIHPEDYYVTFFFLAGCLFSVDMPMMKVMTCDVCIFAGPPRKMLSSQFVLPWQLPPSLSTEPEVDNGSTSAGGINLVQSLRSTSFQVN